MQNPRNGASRPAWLDAGLIETAPLSADERCDVCVVGAGVAGVLVAERLSTAGLDVVVLERGPVGGGETSRTTAHVTCALDNRFTDLRRMHGREGARIAAESHAAAIEHLEDLGRRLAIEFGWRRLDGYLVVNDRHASRRDDLLEEEAEAAREAGLTTQRVGSLPDPWASDFGAALCFPGQAQMHPLRLLSGVVRHLVARGVRVWTGTDVSEIKGGSDAVVETRDGPVVHCRHVVVATNTPINNLLAVHTKQSGYQTYVVGFRVGAGVLPSVLLWDGLWEDDAWYHYLRLYPGGAQGGDDLLIVGGEDHKTGQGPDGSEPFERIESWARARFPVAGPVERRWSGEVMEPADGVAYIGHNAVGRDNVYIVTGDSGMGMTHGAIAAMLIPDLIAGHGHPWATLYDPARKIGVHAAREYARENLNTFAQYADWLRRGDVKREAEIAPGEGAVLVNGLRHTAVFKDESGTCTRLSAVCPHLGGLVRWNPMEKTWDCPCHASRFDRSGKVIHGPANSDLSASDG